MFLLQLAKYRNAQGSTGLGTSNMPPPLSELEARIAAIEGTVAMCGKLLNIMLNTSSDGVSLHKPWACPQHKSSPIQNRITKFGSEDWGPKHLFKIPIQLKNSEFHFV